MADEKSILQQLWIHAYKEGGATVDCGTQAAATRMRFALYNAVKTYRDGKGEPPEVLRKAIDNCAISMTADKKSVIIQPKVSTSNMRAILAVLGDTPIKTAEELAMDESLARIMEKVAAPEAESAGPVLNDTARGYGARG